ncbi:hypothetical protein KQX54_003753 [Cotesia glomerata]|uniref:Uncharacterized protein n=1 Tax=Cotesia glomerata TaxID=32391 RepID=A0AAV7IX78_COTGL|nr:hypothetical protein KQX54_003753 [Cotesia glomerata]
MLCDSGASMMQDKSLDDPAGLPPQVEPAVATVIRGAGGGDESTVSRLGRFRAGGVMVVPATKTTGASRTLSVMVTAEGGSSKVVHLSS